MLWWTGFCGQLFFLFLSGAMFFVFQSPTALAQMDLLSSNPHNFQSDRHIRLSRFYRSLERTGSQLHNPEESENYNSNYNWPYPDIQLLDIAFVDQHSRNVKRRYQSYTKVLEKRARGEGLSLVKTPFQLSVKKPSGFQSPEEFGSIQGDATEALQTAINDGNVWLTPGKTYTVTKTLLLGSNRTIRSDGTATLVFDTRSRDFVDQPELDRIPVLKLMRIYNVSEVHMQDFIVKTIGSPPNTIEAYVQGGVDIRNSSSVAVQGLEFYGFPKTTGVIRSNSTNDLLVEDNLIHGSYTRSPTRQVTGILIDDARTRISSGDGTRIPVNSENFTIRGNLVLGLLLDPSVALNVTFRKPAVDGTTSAMGYEVDGININTVGNTSPYYVESNIVMDVGEALDTFASHGYIRNNHIERTYTHAFKLIHTASHNKFTGNTSVASGFSSVVVANSLNDDGSVRLAKENDFVKNTFLYANAFDVTNQMKRLGLEGISKWPADESAFIHVSGYSQNNVFRENTFKHPMHTNDGRYKASLMCNWKTSEDNTQDQHVNLFWKNRLQSLNGSHQYWEDNKECGKEIQEKHNYITKDISDWTTMNSTRMDLNQRFDHRGESATVDRLTTYASGSARGIHKAHYVNMGPGNTERLTYSAVVRTSTAQTNKIMLREQVDNWLVVFKLNGNGSVIKKSQGSSLSNLQPRIYKISDDWYYISVDFNVKGALNLRPTLRMENPVQGQILDIGELSIR